MYVVANRRNGFKGYEVIETASHMFQVRENGNHVATFKSLKNAIRKMLELAGPNATGNDFYDA